MIPQTPLPVVQVATPFPLRPLILPNKIPETAIKVTTPNIKQMPAPTINNGIQIPQIPIPKVHAADPQIRRVNVAAPQIPKVNVAVPQIPRVNVAVPQIPNVGITIAKLQGPKPPFPQVAIPQANLVIPQVAIPKVGVAVPQVTTPFPGVIPGSPTVNNLVTMMRPLTLNIIKELRLMPWQVDWANRAHQILLRNHGYIDTSRMRSGKTYIVLWLAKMFGFKLLIVCPVIVIDVWRKAAAEYGVELIDVISYQTLRSQKNRQPKHGLLHRHDNTTYGGVRQVHFSPTQEYLNMVEHGTMVVCDEFQNIKNNSNQYKACTALINPIVTGGGRSRFALLSGTPIDKE